MHTLLISQTARFELNSSQVLSVTVDAKTNELEFKFQDYRKRCDASGI
jgi:hypothetical protein